MVSAAGAARFGPLNELGYDDYLFSFRNKLMGQVNLVRIGSRYISENGSFTLTSGVLAREPMPGSCAINMVNAGLEGFVRAAQLELDQGVRVNVVSPVWVQETLAAFGAGPGRRDARRQGRTGVPSRRHRYHAGDGAGCAEFCLTGERLSWLSLSPRGRMKKQSAAHHPVAMDGTLKFHLFLRKLGYLSVIFWPEAGLVRPG